MKRRVSLVACPDYHPAHIEAALERLLAPEGGMSSFVQSGQKVLLKPNLLSAKLPARAVTTHPELVRAVIRLVQQAGGIALVGDSPGIGSPQAVARTCGIMQVVEETSAEFVDFSDSVRINPRGSTFHQLEVARDVLEADVVINLPKLKTHQMMGLTCGVKNLFGAVVGLRKPRLHLQAGADKSFFALMLLDLAEHIAPALTIADAVTGMEGNGPASGDPIFIGALLGSRNPLALDTVATALVGLDNEDVWTQRVALATGRVGSQMDEILLQGDALSDLKCANFRPATSTEVNFNLPAFLNKPLKNSLTAFPTVETEKCLLCGLCIKHCPPKVMSVEKGKVHIDYSRCIGCFCCQELCPQDALITRQGLLLRLTRFLGGR